MRDPGSTPVQQLGQVVDDGVGTMGSQGLGLADPVDSDYETKVARAPGFDARERILEHGCLPSSHTQRMRPRKEGVGCRLALEPIPLGNDAVDPSLEQVIDTG